jgi:transglutaminase-like putative cysteine protease
MMQLPAVLALCWAIQPIDPASSQAAAAPAVQAVAQPAAAPAVQPATEATRVYRVRQVAKLTQVPLEAGLVRWWISVPDNERHQDVLDLDVVSAPGEWRIERDADRGNRFLYVEAKAPKAETLEATIEYTVRRSPVLDHVEPALVPPISEVQRRWYADELRRDAPHMKVDAQVQKIADEVCGKEQNPALQARALLQHVLETADHYSKDASKPKCGIGDALDCLTNGGGCCTDLHSLFIALARARGIPARLQMGYRLNAKNEGKVVDPGYRCWAEYFLPGYGWVSADIVEADAPGGLGPARWFTGLTERRVWLNEGREFRLPGSTSNQRVNTMIIGHAEIDGVVARVLPEGDVPAQLERTVHFVELDASRSAPLAPPAH